MKIELKESERIDDLEFKNLKIIQNKDGFCFGIDSILLADFAKKIKNESLVMDLGTGSGIIAVLLCGKTELKKIIGVEVQDEVAEMGRRTIKLNKLENRFEIINKDILEIDNIYGKNSFDVIVTNPPYKKKSTGILNDENKKTISRHETTASLEDFIKVSSNMLKDKGEFYMVHRPERIVDILTLMRNNKIEPKVLRMVYAKKESKPNLVLIKGIKNARQHLVVEKNLYIYDDNRNYTEEILKIYNKI